MSSTDVAFLPSGEFAADVAADGLLGEGGATLTVWSPTSSSVDCGLSLGSKMAISACVLYFVCSLMVPFSIVPFYEQRQYQHEAGGPTPTANTNGYSDGGPQPERGPPPAGQGPVVQGHNVEYSA